MFKMETRNYCVICQDFEVSIGHGSMQCPQIVCLKCGQKGHTKIHCLFTKENLPFPDEILLKILGYLNVIDLRQCAQVSKRLQKICMDKSLILFRSSNKCSGHTINGKTILIVKCKVTNFLRFLLVNYCIYSYKKKKILQFRNSIFRAIH